MSIITTVYLNEGIIMATDSRITGTTTYQNGNKDNYTLSDNGQKLFLINGGKIGIAHCGNTQIDNKTVSDFIRVFEIEKVEERDSVKEIAEKLKEYVKGKYTGSVIFHVSGYEGDTRYFYRIIDGNIQTVLDESIIKSGVSWNGEVSAISNLITGANGIPINFDFMQLKDGIDFAEFLIDMTCKIHRFKDGIGTCGGAIDVLLLTKDYTKWIRHKLLNP